MTAVRSMLLKKSLLGVCSSLAKKTTSQIGNKPLANVG
jgi:hypothetical protein